MKVIKDIIKGMLIGIANVIPGVSGGTMAVSMGVYDKLIYAINNCFKKFKEAVVPVVPIGIGVVLGLGIFVYLLPFLLKQYPFPTSMTFVGLILGGIPALWKAYSSSLKEKKETIGPKHLVAFLTLMAVAVIFSVLGEKETVEVFEVDGFMMLKLLLVGMVASATMIVPGISGSLVLMILGYYTGVIYAVKSVLEAIRTMNMETLVYALSVTIPFGIGVVLGIFAIARIIEFLFRKFPTITYSAIFGLILASPFAVLWKMGEVRLTFVTVLIGLVLMILGALLAYRLDEQE